MSVLLLAAIASHPSLPWLHNLRDVVATDLDEPLVTSPVENEPGDDPACAELAATALSLTADVAPAAGAETIVASYAKGIVVVGSEGQVLATTPGYACAGSADTVEVLAAGTAFGAPMIVLTATSGGHREQMTWLGLYIVDPDGSIDAVFTGAVEERVGDEVRRGSITVLPGALLVRDPDGSTSYWVWDAEARVFMPPAGYEPVAGAHS